MDIPAKDIEVNEFFAVQGAYKNVYVMRIPPTLTKHGTCQNINTDKLHEIKGHVFVRLIRPDEYYKKVFVV